jgi:hypothetical protein
MVHQTLRAQSQLSDENVARKLAAGSQTKIPWSMCGLI